MPCDVIPNLVERSAKRKRAEKGTHDSTDMMRYPEQDSPKHMKVQRHRRGRSSPREGDAPPSQNRKQLLLHQLGTLVSSFSRRYVLSVRKRLFYESGYFA